MATETPGQPSKGSGFCANTKDDKKRKKTAGKKCKNFFIVTFFL
jgi:hypothetical protein